MNSKIKIALLTLLGFSASACCGTKKTTKSEDKSEPDITIQEQNDPRIQLMYGVPFPDGRVAVPLDDEEREHPKNKEILHDEEPDDVEMIVD